jgi:hypothetical protein
LKTDDSASLLALARQCRSLAKGVSAKDVADSLKLMAEDYERKAAEAKTREAPVEPSEEAPDEPKG